MEGIKTKLEKKKKMLKGKITFAESRVGELGVKFFSRRFKELSFISEDQIFRALKPNNNSEVPAAQF